MTTETIKIQDGEEVIELTGEAKANFIAERNALAQEALLRKAEYEAKRVARANAITKLAEIAGLTETEINAII